MRRILLVLRGAIDEAAVARCWAEVSKAGVEIALCYELPAGLDGLQEGLAAQRSLTALLRRLCGAQAETIPVFVSSQREGESIADFANAWGATEVKN